MQVMTLADRLLAGTARFEDRPNAQINSSNSDIPTHLKRTADGIILIPQPSDDPNDPLVRGKAAESSAR